MPDSLPLYLLNDQGALKAALNVVVAVEQALDDPEGLIGETTAQMDLYTHLGQDSRTSCNRPGALTPAYPSGRRRGS
jgi:hypothetical protein